LLGSIGPLEVLILLIWIAILFAVVYGAVRLALRVSRRQG
jgi:hypothetical protein